MSVTEYTFFSPGTTDAWRTGSMSPSPLTMLGPFPFTFATLGLTTGVPIVTLPAGAVIYDIGIFVTNSWNGTTPNMDIGSFSGNTGLFQNLVGDPVELGDTIVDVTDNLSLQQNQDSFSWLAAAIAATGAAAGDAFNPPELYVADITTLNVVVSQDGHKGGTATGADQGSALVYVLVATPYLG